MVKSSKYFQRGACPSLRLPAAVGLAAGDLLLAAPSLRGHPATPRKERFAFIITAAKARAPSPCLSPPDVWKALRLIALACPPFLWVSALYGLLM